VKEEHGTSSTLRIGVLGCGTVGSALCRILTTEADAIAATTGIHLKLVAVAIRDPTRDDRSWTIPPELLRLDPETVITDPDVDLVVELIGGTGIAGELVSEALRSGKTVVTANKDLIADRGSALFSEAELSNSSLYFEAAVGGALPLIRMLQLSMAGEPIQSVVGILNGTTNYILTSMTESVKSFEEALTEAQDLGYAEADPSADISGRDAAAKAAIIARVAFGVPIDIGEIYCTGIADIPPIAFQIARELGCVIKLLATVDLGSNDGAVVARVHPALVPDSHVLASVGGAYNAVHVRGAWLGECMLYGQGAGADPTASAVLSDILSAARGLPSHNRSTRLSKGVLADRSARFCVVVKGCDQPGVLATVDGLFARHGIAVATILQYDFEDSSRIVLTTRPAGERALSRAIELLTDLDVVDDVEVAIRFMEFPQAAPVDDQHTKLTPEHR
jgi:homoserine dehydrogenase